MNRRLPVLLHFLAVCLLATVHARAASAPAARPQVERADVPTGILYDLALPIAEVGRFDGSTSAPAANAATFRQVVHEFTRAALDPVAWPSARALRDDANPWRVRIALLDLAYDRIREDAAQSGAARIDGDRLVLAPAALETKHAFLAASVRGYTYRGAAIEFVLDAEAFVGRGARPESVEADFGDGDGYRVLRWNEPLAVRYPSEGNYVVRVRATDPSGGSRHAAFAFEVRALAAPVPHDTIPLTGTQAYNGGTATGRAFVYRADVNPVLTNPAVVIEGFDIDNDMNWDELYALLNQEGLVEELRARGYDAVVLDFTNAIDYIQRNAFVAVDLLHQVQAAIAPDVEFPLVGASMGGLVARYALAWMEANADPHRVHNFISFDVPHAGANIPLGIQHWLDFFSSESTEAAELLALLDAPAARQMLLYHHDATVGTAAGSDPLRAAFDAELAGLGDYPSQPRRVALSNGSGAGANQGFAAGAQIIQYQYFIIFFANIRGHVWAVPDGGVNFKIFDGLNQQFGSGPSLIVNVTGTLPWDGAPGGWRNSMAQMDSVAVPVGDIIALHQNHCFIPTVSALDVATANPFYDIAGDADLLSHTPFDAVYVPAENQPHITVTPENAPWLLNEIDPAVTAVREGGAPPALALSAAAPNPFGEHTAVRWQLTHRSHVRVDVFDVRGRRMATLLDAARAAGPGEVQWSGRDRSGRPVPAGVYFLRVQAGPEIRTQRVVRVR